MRLKQLREQRAALVREANQAADVAIKAAQAESRGLSEAENSAQAEFDTRLAALDELIRAEETIAERAASIVPPVLDAGPVRTPRIEVTGEGIERDPNRGFRNVGEFALAVRNASRPMGGVIDRRLLAAPTNFHQESGSAEGAMVPPAMSQAVWALVFDDPLLDLLTIEPTSSNSVDLLADETTPWGASGVTANWRSEGVQLNPSKLATQNRQVRLHELYAFVLATEELLEDAPRLTDRLNVKAPAAIRWKLVESFIFGTGAGQPLGWAHANYAGKIAVTRAVASQVAPVDVAKMFSRLLVNDGPDRSFWTANRDTLPELITRFTVGNMPVWMPPNGMAAAPNGSLLGRPLFFSEHCQTLGTQGDVQLVNPDGYYATQRGPARQDSSIHLYFDYAIQAFRWMFRFGGEPLLSAAVTAAKGSNTKGHFVVLN